MSTATRLVTGMIMAGKNTDNGAASSLHLSLRAGRGRPAEAQAKAGRVRGTREKVDLSAIPPHPARSARHPLPVNGEREDSALAGGGELAAAALYRLMAWLSPSFPVGAFSYSSGIEWAVEANDIKDAETLKSWLDVMLTDGGGCCDAILFAHAYRAVVAGDDKALHDVAELAAAFAPSKERHLETTAQGNAFIEATRAAWGCEAVKKLKTIWDGPVAYPVAVAAASAGHGVPLAPALAAYLQAVAANWVSAGVRLIPLGQSDGQRVLAGLEPAVTATVQRALAASLDDLGSSAFRADLASARHETQYTRLFRS
jgi:urease accessory protein